ncbi:hypothetical protein N9Z27_02380 [Alphaproteobacteria bacterium]|nr:hypothetical protein [Alphaproteobacteria bacterium]
MRNLLLLSISTLTLSACASLVETSIQDLTVETPGAQNATCYVYVDDLRYKAFPPQTINIANTYKDLIVDCLAPGNRRKKVTIPATISKYVLGNTVTGIIPGAVWDGMTNALYRYPDTIQIDFTDVAVQPSKLPAHNNHDIKQPEEYRLEEFLPSTPRLNSDIGKVQAPIRKRQRQTRTATYGSSFISEGESSGKSNPPPMPSKYISPSQSGPSQPSATGAPAPLYPGE